MAGVWVEPSVGWPDEGRRSLRWDRVGLNGVCLWEPWGRQAGGRGCGRVPVLSWASFVGGTCHGGTVVGGTFQRVGLMWAGFLDEAAYCGRALDGRGRGGRGFTLTT